jgi:ribosome-binding ATPase YchF (GTP1/OBG family)
MGKIKSQQNNMNLNFIDEFDLEKVKMLYCMSNQELLLCTNYKDYSQEDNNKYVNNIKSSLKKLILNDSNKINRIYQKKIVIVFIAVNMAYNILVIIYYISYCLITQ